MKPIVGVWGCGVVGSNTANLFERLADARVNVLKYDKYKEGTWDSPDHLIDNSDFIFVCLPTPMKSTGEIDLSYIDCCLCEIADRLPKRNHKIIIIRSTSVSGSSDKFADKYSSLNITFVPEFLTEKDPWQDTVHATRVVIGATDPVTFFTIKSLFYLAYGDQVDYIHMTRSEAEMYKYVCNTLLAMSVMAANEIFFICTFLGINYQKIQENLRYDHRISKFTQVPGSDGDFGIGGKCFPKDIAALAHLAQENGYEPKLLNEAISMNLRIRKKKDWLEIPGAVSDCTFTKKEF